MSLPARHRLLYCLLFLLLVQAVRGQATDDPVFDRKMQLPTMRGTVYELLRKVFDQTEYLFIYDSRMVDSNKRASIRKGTYSLRDAIHVITGLAQIEMKLIDRHVLLQLPEAKPETIAATPELLPQPTPQAIEGKLLDRLSDEPVEYGSINISGAGIGTVANLNGEFKLTIPDSLADRRLILSHVGYQSESYAIHDLTGGHIIFTLDPKVIPLQEVVVRLYNPVQAIDQMMEKRKDNYPGGPVNLVTFYRETVLHNNRLVNLSEGVIDVHKRPFFGDFRNDQMRLLKMRNIKSTATRDTLVTKVMSGLDAILQLDIISHPPDFLDTSNGAFNYYFSDITEINGRQIYVFSFEPKKLVTEPTYQGKLYIDAENYALVKAEFEIGEKYIRQAAGMFVQKQSPRLIITPRRAAYHVTYRQYDGKYYPNYISGELEFRIRIKRKMFSGTTSAIRFEMVTGRIDTENVRRFTRREQLPTRNIFSETRFDYDASYWEHFNIILPDEQLQEAIHKITSIIEEY